MDKLRKIFLIAFIGLVFPCLSLAIPENYFWNNYLVGSSFWSQGENSQNPSYIPDMTQSNIYYPNIYGNGVVSFNNQRMSGGADNTALNVLNLDYITGKKVTIAPGEMLVVNSFSGEASQLYVQGILKTVYLGSSLPYNALTSQREERLGAQITSSSSSYTSATTSEFVNYYDIDNTNFLKNSIIVKYNNVGDSALNLKTGGTNSQKYVGSSVYLLANTGTSNAYISLSSTTVDLTDLGEYQVEKNLVSQKIAYSLHSFNCVGYGNSTFVFLPNLNANIDIYFETSNYNQYSDRNYFTIVGISNLVGNLSFNNNNSLGISVDKVGMMYTKNVIKHSDVDTSKYADYAPIFINRLFGQYKYAVQINGGYVDINNYDELIQKLKEAGFGSGGGSSSADLQRIVSLLDDINSGGATGAEVQELIGILENYHQQMVNNADFGSVTNVFESYKNLLDFSDDMHWLITANNALFGYFAGFVMLCAMFLILNRIMR